MGEKTAKDITIHVSKVSIASNLILTTAKLLAGIFGHSAAMVADAVHSASDVFGSVVVIIGAVVSGKAADEHHPYGHERLECIASFILAAILTVTGFGIGFSGMEKILGGNYDQLAIPGSVALAAAVVSIVVKETLFWYTRAAAKKINSVSLMAEAWHHRSDAFSSIGSFVGIFAARRGYPILDPVASIIICLCIFKVAWDILKETFDKLVDTACDHETEVEIRKIAASVEGVGQVDDLKTRLFGARIYVDIEIAVDGSMRLDAAHEIAEKVHDSIEDGIKGVKHCMVHVNPIKNAGESDEMPVDKGEELPL